MTEKPYPLGPRLRLTVVVYGVLPFGSTSKVGQRGGVWRVSDPVIFDPIEDVDGLGPRLIRSFFSSTTLLSKSLSSTTTRSSSMSGSVGTAS